MRYILLLLLILAGFNSNGQQEPLFGMYWNNYAHYNPATSGLIWGHELNVTYRSQYDGVNGAPNTLFANYNTIVASKHGAGINYVFDAIGFSRIHKANLNYNYQFKLKNDDKIALGVASGIHTITLDSNWISPTTIDDPTLLPGKITEHSLNINTGLAYSSRRILTGIGITQLSLGNSNKLYSLAPHLHAHFSYKLPLTRKSALVLGGIGHTDFVFTSFAFSARYTYLEKLWIGLNYRLRDGVGANFTWDFKNKFRKFRIGYAYEFSINKLSSISKGSHEIVLGMRIY